MNRNILINVMTLLLVVCCTKTPLNNKNMNRAHDLPSLRDNVNEVFSQIHTSTNPADTVGGKLKEFYEEEVYTEWSDIRDDILDSFGDCIVIDPLAEFFQSKNITISKQEIHNKIINAINGVSDNSLHSEEKTIDPVNTSASKPIINRSYQKEQKSNDQKIENDINREIILLEGVDQRFIKMYDKLEEYSEGLGINVLKMIKEQELDPADIDNELKEFDECWYLFLLDDQLIINHNPDGKDNIEAKKRQIFNIIKSSQIGYSFIKFLCKYDVKNEILGYKNSDRRINFQYEYGILNDYFMKTCPDLITHAMGLEDYDMIYDRLLEGTKKRIKPRVEQLSFIVLSMIEFKTRINLLHFLEARYFKMFYEAKKDLVNANRPLIFSVDKKFYGEDFKSLDPFFKIIKYKNPVMYRLIYDYFKLLTGGHRIYSPPNMNHKIFPTICNRYHHFHTDISHVENFIKQLCNKHHKLDIEFVTWWIPQALIGNYYSNNNKPFDVQETGINYGSTPSFVYMTDLSPYSYYQKVDYYLDKAGYKKGVNYVQFHQSLQSINHQKFEEAIYKVTNNNIQNKKIIIAIDNRSITKNQLFYFNSPDLDMLEDDIPKSNKLEPKSVNINKNLFWNLFSDEQIMKNKLSGHEPTITIFHAPYEKHLFMKYNKPKRDQSVSIWKESLLDELKKIRNSRDRNYVSNIYCRSGKYKLWDDYVDFISGITADNLSSEEYLKMVKNINSKCDIIAPPVSFKTYRTLNAKYTGIDKLKHRYPFIEDKNLNIFKKYNSIVRNCPILSPFEFTKPTCFYNLSVGHHCIKNKKEFNIIKVAFLVNKLLLITENKQMTLLKRFFLPEAKEDDCKEEIYNSPLEDELECPDYDLINSQIESFTG